MINTSDDLKRVIEEINQNNLLDTKLKLNFDIVKPNKLFELDIKENDLDLSLDNCGSGVRRAFYFALLLTYVNTVPLNGNTPACIFLLEEPELHLHSQACRIMYDKIKNRTTNNNQIIYTTHSSYMINIRDDVDSIRIIRKDDDGTQTRALTTSHWDDKFKAMFQTKKSLFTEALFAKKLILVEGAEDEFVFNAYIKNDPSLVTEDFLIIDCHGAGDISKVYKIYEGYVPCYIILDSDGREAFPRIFDELSNINLPLTETIITPKYTLFKTSITDEIEKIDPEMFKKLSNGDVKKADMAEQIAQQHPTPPLFVKIIDNIFNRV